MSLKKLSIFSRFKEDNFNYRQLRKILGFRPVRIEYFKTAFIPRSSTITYKDGSLINNERLEYLGDAIFDAIIADFLFQKFPGKDEGFLTTMRSKIVNGENLRKLALQLGIDKFLQFPLNKNNTSKNIYGDAFEALIGAVYCDRGYNKTKSFVRKKIINKYINLNALLSKENNYKSKIIEWGQKNRKEISFDTYPENPDEDISPVFVSVLKIENIEAGTGKGASKKLAEQKAAKIALQNITAYSN
ncbi:ribonuclease III [Bacteroidota bacterium]